MPKGFDYEAAYRRQDQKPTATPEQKRRFHEETLPRLIEEGFVSGEVAETIAALTPEQATRKAEVGRDIMDRAVTSDIENDVLTSHGYRPELPELGPRETFLDIINTANEKRKDSING